MLRFNLLAWTCRLSPLGSDQPMEGRGRGKEELCPYPCWAKDEAVVGRTAPNPQIQWVHKNRLETTLASPGKWGEERRTQEDTLNLKKASVRLVSGLDTHTETGGRLNIPVLGKSHCCFFPSAANLPKSKFFSGPRFMDFLHYESNWRISREDPDLLIVPSSSLLWPFLPPAASPVFV